MTKKIDTTLSLFVEENDNQHLPEVTIWTDGCCLKNPGGAGGWGAILVDSRTGIRREISGHVPMPTTNNRAEWLGIIEALDELKQKCRVTIITDSQICVYALMGRGKKLHRRGNQDLVQRAIKLASEHIVTARWVRGHSGIPENERCDHLAMRAALSVKYENKNIV